MADCLFCRIADKSLDAVIVWEEADVLAFLDIGPIRESHCQVIPKRHVETFEQMSPELAGKVLELGQRLARKMKSVYQIERVAFLFTGGDVPHVHAHVVPMLEKTDITSARYIVNSGNVQYSSQHLRTDRDALLRVKEKLAFA